MTTPNQTPTGIQVAKGLNYSKLISQVVGFFAPALLIWVGDLQDWLTSHPALTPLAAVLPVATAWIAGRGTEKGSLGKKKKPDTETFETGEDSNDNY